MLALNERQRARPPVHANRAYQIEALDLVHLMLKPMIPKQQRCENPAFSQGFVLNSNVTLFVC